MRYILLLLEGVEVLINFLTRSTRNFPTRNLWEVCSVRNRSRLRAIDLIVWRVLFQEQIQAEGHRPHCVMCVVLGADWGWGPSTSLCDVCSVRNRSRLRAIDLIVWHVLFQEQIEAEGHRPHCVTCVVSGADWGWGPSTSLLGIRNS